MFDALNGKHINGIDLKDGTPFRGRLPMMVRFVDDDEHADGWIEVADDGLLLNFTSHDAATNKRAESVLLNDIAVVL